VNDPEAIRKLVESAREEAARDQGRRESELQAGAGEAHGKAAAAQLRETLPGRLLQICLESSGAMQWGSEELSSGGTEFQLRWVDPEPRRTLSVLVEESGIVLWGWFCDWLRPSYVQMNAAGFTEAYLMSLVVALGDQAAWEDRRVPDLGPFPPSH
jgi:hypothetical protein